MKCHRYFKEMDDELNISYDRFIRTTEPEHHAASQAIWQAMEANGDLYLDRYEGWYSVRDEAYYDEKELVDGEGGEKLSPQGTPVEWTVEESWFFRLSQYQEPLLALYAAQSRLHPARKPPQRDDALRRGRACRTCRSRAPASTGACKVPGSDDHVMYVWVDALTNYLTGVGYPDDTDGLIANSGRPTLHIIGKDIVRFHAVYWPAFLMSAGHRRCRSRCSATASCSTAARRCRSRSATSSIRSSWPTLRRRSAALFPAARGHLRPGRQLQRRGDRHARSTPISPTASAISRSARLSFIAKNCDGELPRAGRADRGRRAAARRASLAARRRVPAPFEAARALSQALEAWMRAVFACNQYIDAQAPWALRKTDPDADERGAGDARARRSATSPSRSSRSSRRAADKLLDQMGVAADERDLCRARRARMRIGALAASGFTSGAADPHLPEAGAAGGGMTDVRR